MMHRTETIGEATLHLGDCREIEPGPVDAIVTDPPYGIGFQKGAGGLGIHPGRVRNLDPIHGDDEPFDPAPWLQWPCVMFGGNHFYARLPDGGTFHTWDKSRGVGPADSFSDAEYVWTSWRRKSEVFRYLWKGVLQDGEKGLPKFHIMQKPIAVMQWCLGFVPDARAIFDPFMGSGSTGIAAIKSGRRFVGIEIEPKYFDIACRRIDEAVKQPDLFVAPTTQPATQLTWDEMWKEPYLDPLSAALKDRSARGRLTHG
jgi:site-specific DNA-methyltransferase (adenine-specific)